MDTITAPIWVPPESQNVVAMETSNQLDSATGQYIYILLGSKVIPQYSK